MRYTFDIASRIKAQTDLLPKALAESVVGRLEEEFVELLKDAPQKSGNYVANMAVAAGGRIGRKGPVEYFDPDPTNAQIVRRGSTPAISVAMMNNKNLQANLTKHITVTTMGWLSMLTVYNRIDYADEVEEYTAAQLADKNKPGVHAMDKFRAKVASRLNINLRAGNVTFNGRVKVS